MIDEDEMEMDIDKMDIDEETKELIRQLRDDEIIEDEAKKRKL